MTQRKGVKIVRLEIRSNNGVETLHVEGYVNAVERYSRTLHGEKGAFKEKVNAGTFKKALNKAQNVRMLLNHDESVVLADTQSGLKLHEDAIGLFASADITNEHVIKEARAGHLKGWSFGFNTVSDTWEDGEDGISKRSLDDINLLEVSLLTITPAYIGTMVNATETRALDDVVDIIDTQPRDDGSKEDRSYLVEIQKVKNWALENSI